MKKRLSIPGLLIPSSLLFVIAFLVAWYNDHLFARLFVLLLPVYFALLVAFVVLLVKDIHKIAKDRDLSCFLSIGVLILLAVLIVWFPFRDAKVRFELDLLEKDRLEVVEMIRNDQLSAKDGIGNIDLPMGYRRLSSDGQVFLYENDENGQVVCFWVFRGLLSGSFELIYSSGGEELIRANEKKINAVRIEKLKENWYYVETG